MTNWLTLKGCGCAARNVERSTFALKNELIVFLLNRSTFNVSSYPASPRLRRGERHRNRLTLDFFKTMPLHVLKVQSEDEHTRLDVFLTKHLTCVPSRSFVKKLIDFGHVKINEVRIKAHHKVVVGEEVHVEIPEDFLKPQYVEPEDIPLDIFYEDQYLLVINKPTGLLVHPATGIYSGTLVNALLHLSINLSDVNTDLRPGIVHRLDQETSGLIVVAKDNITHTRLAKQFQRHTVKKRYVALVDGEVAFDEGRVDAPLGRHPHHRQKRGVIFDSSAKDAVTTYRVLRRHKGISLVALFPKTGRTHQLRVHMRHLGYPILGDSKYGKKSSFPRLALHAQSIGFTHPHRKCTIEFATRIPKEFLEVFEDRQS